ncbi:MAG TPA: hypothetical protein VJ385_07125 [Fibrobacteria bacterium]|nr:hypothetical protein [Fibrobacteria bacterium]
MASRFGRAFSLFSLLLLSACPSWAQDPNDVERKVRPEGLAVPKAHAIPYPNGALYVHRGITGAFMGGKHRNLGEDQSLYQWQGELGYFYEPWLSGGLGYKITAGEPSFSEQKIFNRYFINLRLHKNWRSAAAYLGGQLGMGNLNLTDSASDTSRTVIPDGPIKSIKNTKPTLGLDLGGGWMFSKYVGLTLGNHLEYSLVTEEGVGWSNALNIHVNPGLALDVLAFTDAMRELVPALFVNVEVQSGFLIFEKRGKRQDRNWVLGLSLAF